MRLSLPAVVAGLALLLPVAGAAQVSMGIARSPGVTFHAPPSQPRPDAAPASDRSPGRHGGRREATGGDQFLADKHTYAPRYDRPVHARHYRRTPRIGVSPYYVSAAELVVTPVLTPPLSLAGRDIDAGILRLQIDPPSAQVFIDGTTFGDSGPGTRDSRFGTRGSPDTASGDYLLEAGVHRVELEAEGFQPASFDARIRPGDTLTLSPQLTSLDRTGPRAAAVSGAVTVSNTVAPASPKTLYVIPRCYAGDRRPDPAQLLPGCDPARMRVIPAGR
jgi:hypothetical protein